MTTPQPFGPEWQRQFVENMRKAGEALGHAQHVLSAQAAMGWAYRGDLAAARTALTGMSPDQLRELSAAASMLAAIADEELSSR